jgi:hypothetical protein
MITLNNNKEFFNTPKDFFIIDTFTGTKMNCTHEIFTTGKGEKNVKGQYRLTKTCTECMAYRVYLLYAKKGGRK